MILFKKSIIIHSGKSAFEIVTLLKTVTGKISIPPFGKPFLGTIGEKSFELWPMYFFVKSRPGPRLYGEIIEKDGHTEVHIEAKLLHRNLVITSLVMGMLLCANTFVKGIFLIVSEGVTEYNLLQVIGSILIMIIIPVAVYLSFELPAKSALNRLKELLE